MEVPGNLWYSGGGSTEYTFRANVSLEIGHCFR